MDSDGELNVQVAECRGVLRRLQQELRALHRRGHRQAAGRRKEGSRGPLRARTLPDPGALRSLQ